MEWALAFAAALAVVAVFFVARPFLHEPAPASDRLDELAPEARQRLALAEERDRALMALKELEFDHRTGKIDDVDYRALVGPLRRQAAEALQALDARTGRGSGELDEQERVQRDDDGGDRGRGRGRRAPVDKRPHQVGARGEPDQRDEGERNPERQDDL